MGNNSFEKSGERKEPRLINDFLKSFNFKKLLSLRNRYDLGKPSQDHQ